MYAIVSDSGTQFYVEEGQTVLVDLKGAPAGETIEFDKVLLVGTDSGPKIGHPTVAGAKVTAQVIGDERMDKVRMVVYKRRKNFRKRRGHRQSMTQVRIEKIAAGD